MPRLSRIACPLLIGVLALAVGGCRSKRSPMVMVVYIPPAGLTATSVDARVAGAIGRRLRSTVDVVGVTSISRADEVDFYVIGAAGSGVGPLADRARTVATATELPAGGRLTSVAFLNSEKPIPDAEAGSEPAFSVTVDASRAAAAGVTTADIDAAVNAFAAHHRPATVEQVPALLATPVTGARGAAPKLGDIATASIQQQPTSVRHDF